VPIDEGGVAPVGTHSHTLTRSRSVREGKFLRFGPVRLRGREMDFFCSYSVVREGNDFFAPPNLFDPTHSKD
jgi:hypothetical protein